MIEIHDFGGVNVMQEEHIKTVDGKTPGDTRLLAYDMSFAEAIIEKEGKYYRIDSLNSWYPEEITDTEAMLDIAIMIPTIDTPHLRRRAHLDQIIGKVRRQFTKSGQVVSQSIVQAIPRSK